MQQYGKTILDIIAIAVVSAQLDSRRIKTSVFTPTVLSTGMIHWEIKVSNIKRGKVFCC